MDRPDEFSHDEFLKRYGPLGPEMFATRGEGSSVIRRAFKGGYQIQNIDGVFAQFNAKTMDEIYLQPGLGILNISKALSYVRGMGKKARSQRFGIDDAMREHISTTEYDPALVASMSEKRRDEPVLLLQRGPGIDMIDGHHRLQRRFRDGLHFFDAITIAESSIDLIRVDTYRKDGDIWRKFDAATQIQKTGTPTVKIRRAA